MNTDIRLSVGFWQHPKTKKTVMRLGLEGIRSLQILWLWASVNRSDGVLSGMDWEDIELTADWQGEERTFFDLCLGMWIDETPEGYVLHDWQEHNPWQAEAEARKEQARANALSGWEKRRAAKQAHERGNTDGNAGSMPQPCDGNATAKPPHDSGNAPSPYPSPEEINTHTLSSRARGKKPPASEPEKDRYGENGKVLLTRTQYENLCARFGKETTGKAIALLDLHIGAKGRDDYKDHNLALQKWVFDAVKEREARQARAAPGGQQRAGMSRNGNTDAGGRNRNYGQSIIPEWGQSNDAGR